MHGNKAAEEAEKNYKISGILNNFCSARTNRLTPLILIRIAIGLKKVSEFLLPRY